MTKNNSLNAPNAVIQRVYTSISALVTLSTAIPYDDTIPQKTEGDEVLTLAITPKSASNVLEIAFTTFTQTGTSIPVIAALFQDATAGALAATTLAGVGGATEDANGSLNHTMVAGTTSATTFKIRCGPNSATTIYLNGNSGARKYGGVASTTLTITEYLV